MSVSQKTEDPSLFCALPQSDHIYLPTLAVIRESVSYYPLTIRNNCSNDSMTSLNED